MADPRQLARLVAEVRRAGSPVRRMKVLARAWRTLSRLAPAERAALAAEVGIDGAEEIVERMASRYGRLKPAVILQALDKARGAEPGQVRELFRGLRDPRRRKQILRQGLQAVTTELADEPAAPAVDAPAPALSPAARLAAREPRAGTPRTEGAELSPGPPESRSAASTTAGAVVATPVAGAAAAARTRAAAAPEPEPGPDAARPASGNVSPAVKRPPKPEAVEVHRPGPAPAEARPTAARQATRAAPVSRPAPLHPPRLETPEKEAQPAGDLVARIGAADGVLARLRGVRTHARQARGQTVATLRRLLDLFPEPWARRRALAALLEHQVPGNLDDALALIDDLGSPGAHRFCIGTILDRWSLSDRVRGELRARRRQAAP